MAWFTLSPTIKCDFMVQCLLAHILPKIFDWNAYFVLPLFYCFLCFVSLLLQVQWSWPQLAWLESISGCLMQWFPFDKKKIIDFTKIILLQVQWSWPQLAWLPMKKNHQFIKIIYFLSSDDTGYITSFDRVPLTYTGDMEWWPSATLLSPCIIDVTFFPFDYQQCSLTIGPWGYHSEQVCAWGVSKKKCNSLVNIKQWKTITFIYLYSDCCGKMWISTSTWMRICIWYKKYWRWVWQY